MHFDSFRIEYILQEVLNKQDLNTVLNKNLSHTRYLEYKMMILLGKEFIALLS